MVLRRPGTIHRTISMNSNIEKRKSKKFKLRMKAKRERAGVVKSREPTIVPEDAGLITVKAIKSRTRKNPGAVVKLSNKKRNKILKQLRHQKRDQETAAAEAISEAEPSTSGTTDKDLMETQRLTKTKKKSKATKVETMECD